MEQKLQVLPRERKINIFDLANEIYDENLAAAQVRDLFFMIARQSEFYGAAHHFGLTYVPQYGPDAGKIFHFLTAARLGSVSLPDLVLENTSILPDKKEHVEIRLPNNYAFVFDELRHYSEENSIGVVWCITDQEKANENVASSLKNCAKLIEFITKKFKLAHAIGSLIELDNSPKSTEQEIDSQLVQSLKSAVSPDSVMVWRVHAFTRRLAVCAGTHNWNLKLDVGEGVAGKCADDQKIIVINDFKDRHELNSKGIVSVRHQKFVDTLQLRSGMFVPIIISNSCDSVVACYFRRPHGVTQTEKDIIRFVDNNYRYYRTLFKSENAKFDGREKIQRLAALMTFARDARSYVHDATALLNKADQRLSVWNPREEIEKTAREIVGQALEEARKHLSIALTLTEPPKIVRSGNVLFETHEDVSRHNITNIIRNIVAFYESEARASSIQIKVKIADNLRFSLSASKFRRALSNIIDNAIYELKKQSTETRVIEINVQLEEAEIDSTNLSELIVFITDNGPGIKKEIFDTITEYFATTKEDEGYGFGLGIVKDIMDAHGGQLLWRNKGRGAEFELRFPSRV